MQVVMQQLGADLSIGDDLTVEGGLIDLKIVDHNHKLNFTVVKYIMHKTNSTSSLCNLTALPQVAVQH